jgi:hypothetical protein
MTDEIERASEPIESNSHKSEKEHYKRPVLIDWGTLEELTQSAGWSGKSDGGRFIFTKTR